MPARLVGVDLTGAPVVEERTSSRPGAGMPKPASSQVELFEHVGGLFEDQANARDRGTRAPNT